MNYLEDRFNKVGLGIAGLVLSMGVGAGTYKFIEEVTSKEDDIVTNLGFGSIGILGGLAAISCLGYGLAEIYKGIKP